MYKLYIEQQSGPYTGKRILLDTKPKLEDFRETAAMSILWQAFRAGHIYFIAIDDETQEEYLYQLQYHQNNWVKL